MKFIAIVAIGMVAVPFAAVAGGPMDPAAEVMVQPPMVIAPPATDGDWGGFYAGAQLGYGNITSNGAGLDGNNAIGGLHAGYRADLGRVVLGGELDYNFANIELGKNLPNTSIDTLARAKVIVGYDLGRALVYVTGGAAYAEATLINFDASDNGYFAGVGMDYKATETINVGAELLAHRFENYEGTNIDIEAVTLQAKVAYRF